LFHVEALHRRLRWQCVKIRRNLSGLQLLQGITKRLVQARGAVGLTRAQLSGRIGIKLEGALIYNSLHKRYPLRNHYYLSSDYLIYSSLPLTQLN
jgi:hypothetical protein